jgi:hypothetical protein
MAWHYLSVKSPGATHFPDSIRRALQKALQEGEFTSNQYGIANPFWPRVPAVYLTRANPLFLASPSFNEIYKLRGRNRLKSPTSPSPIYAFSIDSLRVFAGIETG